MHLTPTFFLGGDLSKPLVGDEWAGTVSNHERASGTDGGPLSFLFISLSFLQGCLFGLCNMPAMSRAKARVDGCLGPARPCRITSSPRWYTGTWISLGGGCTVTTTPPRCLLIKYMDRALRWTYCPRLPRMWSSSPGRGFCCYNSIQKRKQYETVRIKVQNVVEQHLRGLQF